MNKYDIFIFLINIIYNLETVLKGQLNEVVNTFLNN